MDKLLVIMMKNNYLLKYLIIKNKYQNKKINTDGETRKISESICAFHKEKIDIVGRIIHRISCFYQSNFEKNTTSVCQRGTMTLSKI